VRILVLFVVVCSTAVAQPRSGIEFASPEVRQLQASDAENPGMLWVDQGAKLFAQRCASCHDSMKGVAARYPRVVEGKILTLEEKIRQKGSLAYESDDLLALAAYVAHQSRGMPIQIDAADRDLLRGKTEYLRRRGQMNLACAHCHDAHAGMKLGAETISQGQANGYPAYRLEWQRIGSLSRRIRSCMFGLHAELPPFGSELLLELELYLAARARGLPVETPAVRR
jgi:sulfur-oxidizing protein SoxA